MANKIADKGKGHNLMAGWILLLAVGAVIVLYQCFGIQRETYDFEPSEEVFCNPLMGFAPNADYVEAVGDNTLVYVDVTWRELEPEEGSYDFSGINESNYLDKWKSEGKRVVFRFICDVPDEEAHMDIPDWLYEKTGDGTFYDMVYGKGYSPNYSNETFIACHKRAIEELGAEYGQDDFFVYIELGSIGHWGEWHVKYDEGITRIPGEAIIREYITPYIDAFPNAKILMRRPFEAVNEYGFGVYNDMTGDKESTEKWLSWIAEGTTYKEAEEELILPAVKEVWNVAPVGGEFTSSIPMEDMLLTEQERTLALLAESHMTFIGPKCPIACDEEISYPKETDAIRAMLGYRYGVSKAKTCYDRLTRKLKVSVTIKNYGVAPMYFDWPVCIYLLDEEHEIIARYETEICLSQITQGKSAETTMQIERKDDVTAIAVGIEDPKNGEPSVYLDMDASQENLRYIINE